MTATSRDGQFWSEPDLILNADATLDGGVVADPSGIELPAGGFRVYYGTNGQVHSVI